MSADESTQSWMEITGVPGCEVSDFGRVRSWRTGGWRPGIVHQKKREPTFLRIWTLPHGYQYVCLGRPFRPRRRYVHRLVLEAFVGPCPEGMQCCHWDGNPSNNCLTNLRWDTPKNNRRDADRHHGSRFGSNCPVAKLNELEVQEIRHLLSAGWLQREVAEQFGVTQPAISAIASGKRWAHVD